MRRTELAKLRILEEKLGIHFKNREFLRKALTHKSYANEYKLGANWHNERYEFLGDAVLELCISHLLLERFQDLPEGDLSKLRAAVVNETQLALFAKKIQLGEVLFLGRGEDQTGGREKPSLLSNAFEAVLGAMYLDRGFPKVLEFVKERYQLIIEKIGETGFVQDYKTRLQEKVQALYKMVPQYKLMRSFGPDHAKTFEVHLLIQEALYGVGKGNSKKAAEQEAAKQALEKLSSQNV